MTLFNRSKRVPDGVLGRSPEGGARTEGAPAGETHRESGSRPLPSPPSYGHGPGHSYPPLQSQPIVRRRESQRAAQTARVLLVEPVPVLRTIITRAFADRGHSVTAVGSLEEMRRLMPSFDPHVVICELTLPDGAGDTACRRLKANASKLRPVVLISGVPEGELKRRAMQVGADRFHCKSRGLSELIELVEELSEEIVF